MHLRIEQADLLEGLRTVVRAAATRQTIPTLTGVLLQSGDAMLTLRATDLELSVARRLPVRTVRTGAVVIPARQFFELVRRFPRGDLELSVDPGTSTALLTAPDTELTIHGYPADQFPAPAGLSTSEAVEVGTHHLQALLRETGFAIATDESRPWFTGVALSVRGETARAVATDGAILASAEVPVRNPAALSFSVIMPGRTAQELARLAGEAQAELCQVSPSHNLVRFRLGDTEVGTRLLDGQYPDVVRVLPSSYATAVQTDIERLAAACERALLVCRDGTARLAAGPDGFRLSARSPEVGQVSERIPASVTGPGFEVGLNLKFVLEGLRMMGSGPLLLEFAGVRSAVRFRRGAQATSFFAVMPLVSF